MDFIELIGLRQNNLKNISLRIPHDCLTVITGLSGSGKSSLAFDTLYAEGQWRFIESLSTYARLFLNKLDRPAVDAIHNLRPAIALEQKNPVKGSRSTVGTLTEIYDLLRILYSRLAVPFCPECGKQIVKWSPEKVVVHLLENYHSERAMVVFETDLPGRELMKEGFYRYWDGSSTQDITPDTEGPLEVVVDRLKLNEPSRLSEAVELAFKKGAETVKVYLFRNSKPEGISFSSSLRCDHCGFILPEPTPVLFSFNHPIGACPECKGFGNVLYYDEDLIVPDPDLSLEEGAIEVFQKPAAKWWQDQLIKGAKKAGINTKVPFKDLSEDQKKMVFEGTEHFYGVNDFFEELEQMTYKLHVRVFLSRYRTQRLCPVCKGKRLKPEALAYRFSGKDIAELSGMSVTELVSFFEGVTLKSEQQQVAKEALEQIQKKLNFLSHVGLGYLTLDRQARTLSGGEYQRVNLANQIGSALTGTLYVLDEPTVGLHPRDTSRIVKILKDLAAEGNTVVIVEHDQEVIKSADFVVELGPGGGRQGGEVVFSGTMQEFLKQDTLTARYIKGLDRDLLEDIKEDLPEPQRFIELHGARGHNLKDITFRVPLQRLVVVTGVSGSGKSSLVVETLYRAVARRLKVSTEIPLPYDSIENLSLIKGIRLIDQSPIGRTPRSNPATYLGLFDIIRKIFAAEPYAVAMGYKPGFFSFNVKGGRCERCRGEGYEKLEMYFFEDLYVRCEECGGTRYTKEALKVHYKGKNIHEVLQMTVDEAREFFSEHRELQDKLRLLSDMGLGYLVIGQPATTLSGGEAQRLKIATELLQGKKGPLLFILDEPTVGLHYQDVVALLRVLRRLIRQGHTVVAIEHNLDFIYTADWVVDLGPEGGPEGGRIVYEGPVEGITKVKASYTGRFLKQLLS